MKPAVIHVHRGGPVVALDGEGRLEAVRERMADLLYDRMVAYHVLRGVAVPLAAAEFRQGLAARFAQRDEMLCTLPTVLSPDGPS